MLDRRTLLAGAGCAALAGGSSRSAVAETDAFEQVSPEGFRMAIDSSSASPALRRQLARFHKAIYNGLAGSDFGILRGDLSIDGDWSVPSLQACVLGDVRISGLCDLANPKGYDEGGALVVLGSVRCRALSNLAGGKVVLIGGNLTADEAILNDAEDSTLVVTENLTTRWYQGIDIWAEVGGTAAMDYGDGYCLPLGYDGANPVQIDPRHDRATSMAALSRKLDPASQTLSLDMLALIRRGESIFASI